MNTELKGLSALYRPALGLLTDLYQLTMAYGYWKTKTANQEAVFHLYFRANPFQGGFTVACGLQSVVDYLKGFEFREEDVAYLATLKGSNGQPLFEKDFLVYLKDLKLTCDVDAVTEGTVVFPYQPLVRVKGPILQCQLLESCLLNLVNFQTLIATKAARVCLAAQGDPVVEFGLRRAQGIDGGLSASRAAYVGGASATSNVLAGRLFGIPVSGTHAHSWVMSFENEIEAFEAYVGAMPNNAILLVDTYDTLKGVQNAINAGKKLRAKGYELGGIRLDSGDLAYLSIAARKLLDDAGFKDTRIVASNDLDENIITSLKSQGAAINVWGVGTRLATAYDQPALGGVYKLSAIRKPGASWQYRIKVSDQNVKTSIPGIHQVKRFVGETGYLGDSIYDVEMGLDATLTTIDPLDMTRRKTFPKNAKQFDLLVPVMRAGKLVYEPPSAAEARAHAFAELALLHPTIKRFVNPHFYPVGLDPKLFELRTGLILSIRGGQK